MSVFIHIGLPKTASTFLQTKYFSILDEKKMIVYNPPEVISNINLMLNHFNENILDHSLTDLGIKLSDSLALYKEQKVLISSEGLTTEGYSLSYGKQLSFLSKYIKNAKIILVLRDPCDWSISMYRQSVHQKNPQSITKSLTKNDYDNNLRQYTRIELIKSYLNDTNYLSLIKDYREAYTDVKILFYEDFVEDKVLFISKISEFIGINSIDISKSNKIVNRGLSSTAINFLISLSRILNLFNIKIPYQRKKPLPQNSSIRSRVIYYFSWVGFRILWQNYIDKFIYLDFKMKKSDIFSSNEILKFNKMYRVIRNSNN